MFVGIILVTCLLDLLSVSIIRSQDANVRTRLEPVPLTYFGLHVHFIKDYANLDPLRTKWPDVQFGTIRFWGTNTTWRELEPTAGKYEFSRLDALVDGADRHHVQPILGLGLPPQWASAHPNEGPKWRVGSSAPPADMQQWKDYVRTVVSRYRGRIVAYEVWNEANNPDFFTGDHRTLLELTKEASAIIRREDPQALIISPSFTGKNTALRWLDQFLADGGAQYVDIIGYHFYVFPDPPESIFSLAHKVRDVMNRHHVDKPIWNTESSWLEKNTVPAGQQAAYVFRAFLVGWAGGIDRFYWYAWDEHSNISIEFVDRNNHVDTSAADGWKRATEWLLDQWVGACTTDVNGTWTCHVNGSGGDSSIAWNPSGPALYAASGHLKWIMTPLVGQATEISGDSIPVGVEPLKITPAP